VRIGLIIGLHGTKGDDASQPTWARVKEQALAAEAAGFDLMAMEDSLYYRDEDETLGYWESVSVAGAVAAATSRIEIAHGVLNAPYRSAALTAKIAETLDEISGGRYILGIGSGNTFDYDQFGFAADKRYSRLAEALEIIHALLKTGSVEFKGDFHFAMGAEMILRGPRPTGPPIVIAAGKPRMLRLAARFGDGWNWWTADKDPLGALRPVVEEFERACADVGRDPSTLPRSVDLYSIVPPALAEVDQSESTSLRIGGSSEEIAMSLLSFRELRFDEVRCNLAVAHPRSMPAAIASMAGVVAAVHAA
jgi:alkanesulfonate monooxygenase SsuD/methylene tetrahydromethanopterin reductase-like flavin-dependent oxidoreductase (luciferase family)